MAQYVILIYENESTYTDAPPEMLAADEGGAQPVREQVGELGGKILGGEALQPTGTATSIRGDVVTDGPFAETKEALGGFYLIEARTSTRPWPSPSCARRRFGGVEVRPVMDTLAGERYSADDPAGRVRHDGPAVPTRRAVADAHRREWAFVLAATARVARRHRPGRGVRPGRVRRPRSTPGRARACRDNPAAWLTTAARRRAIDAQRRDQTLAREAAAARSSPSVAPAAASRTRGRRDPR